MAWLSKRAVLWALDEAASVPPHLVSALIAVARYAGEDGRGAHPSALTVAGHIRKTERTAKKDLAELRQLGLLLPGDQRIVAAIRADKRPFVYDLPMPRGVAQDTPSTGHGVSHRTPEEFLKNSSTRARADGAGAPPPPRPGTRYTAPPCPVCGEPFSQEWLADPATRSMALAGDIIHEECREEDNRRYELAHPDEAGQ